MSKQFAKVTRNPGDNPEQLQMFMRPHEILNKLHGFMDATASYIDDPKDYPYSDLHDEKLSEAKSTGLHDSIETDGVRDHIVLTNTGRDTFLMGNGHHRLSVALDLEEKGHQVDIPVIHDNNFM